MKEREVLLNPNKLVRFLKKPAEEFTKHDIIQFIGENNIELLNFRYVGEDGKLKTLNFVITSKDERTIACELFNRITKRRLC